MVDEDEDTIKPIGGAEVKPDVSRLTPEGKIEYYAPGADMSKDEPIKDKTIVGTYVPETEADTQSAPLYRVTDKDGRSITCKIERKGSVLTITADVDFATLSVRLSGVSALRAQGVERIVFITNGARSTLTLSALLKQGDSGTYKLTHDGKKATLTVG